MFIQDGLEIWKNKSKSPRKKNIDLQNIHKEFYDDEKNLSLIDVDTVHTRDREGKNESDGDNSKWTFAP